MSVRDESALSRETRACVEAYLARVARKMRRAGEDADVVAETVGAIRTHLLEELDERSGAEDALRVISEIGEVDGEASANNPDSTPLDIQGRFLGMPYDFRPPTVERIVSRWWAPADPRILMPKIFGIGWGVNFGALAVRLRLIEPDAEDMPFASVPEPALLAALMVPVAFAATVVGSYLGTRELLPEMLAVHWDWRGVADGFAPASRALILPLVMAIVPTCWAVGTFVRRRSAFHRAIAIAAATFLGGLGVWAWGLSLIDVFIGRMNSWTIALSLVGVSVVLPLTLLTLLARAGRGAEIRRDTVRHRPGI